MANTQYSRMTFQKCNKINLGRKHSEITRKRMSESLKGRVSPNKGKKLGPHTEQWKRNMSTIMNGRTTYVMTPEIKQKISESLKGRYTGENNPNYGEKSPQWVGDDIKYVGLHQYIRRHKPKPADGNCEICHEESWYDAACVTGIYNRDFKNWMFMCHKCHVRFDGTSGRKPGSYFKRDPKTGRFMK